MQPGADRRSISHYELLEKVGEGGMGVVYRAHDRKLDRIVALKFLHGSALDSAQGRDRFVHEARAISRLSHRHIAVIHAIEESDDQVFLVFEYLPGGTLRSRLQAFRARGERMRPEQVAAYGLQIAEGLAHAHAAGMIHRDVKPGNIMFGGDGDLKIVDFGLSKLRGRTQITQAGARLGTPLYMSPEQAQGQDLDERSDIFSLGVVLFEMAAGRPPFASDQPEGIVHQIIHTPVPRLRESDPAFPAELDTIISRAIKKDPDERYPRMLDLAAGLRSFLDSCPPGADQVPTASLSVQTPRSIWKRWPWALATVLVVVLASIVALKPLRDKYGRNAAAAQFYEQGTALLYRFYIPANIDKSITAFTNAVHADPAFTDAYASLSQAYWRKYLDVRDRKFLDEARTNAEKALALDSGSVSAQVAQGAVLNESGDHENAIAEFRRALSKDPGSVEATKELALVYVAAGNLTEAEALFNKAAKLRPNDWDTWSESGVFHYHHQKYAQAEKDFSTAVSLAPDNPVVHRNLGAVAMALDQLGDAEKEFQASLRLDPSSGSNYSDLGALYIYQGRYRDAIDALEKAIQLTSANFRYLYILWANLAEAYRYTPEQSSKASAAFDRAIQEVEKRLAFAPNDPDLLSVAAVCRAKVGERGPAVDEIGRAIGFAHGNRDVSFRAALVYELTGARDRALAALEDAIHGGYSLSEIERDPALAKLRQDSRYRQLVASSK